MAAITVCSDLGVQENKICHCFHFFPPIFHEVMGPDAMSLFFLILNFKPAFSLSFTLNKRLFRPLHFLPLKWYHCISEMVDISPRNLNSSFDSFSLALQIIYSLCLSGKESTWSERGYLHEGNSVWSLGWQNPLEKEMATHSSTLG